MEKLLADTNIFGIAVDRNDKRRKSVWKILDRAASGEVELHVAQIVVEEIKQNPHKPTLKKELELVENLTTEIHGLDNKSEKLADKLENNTCLDVIDSRIIAIAVSNGLTFWSGDYGILREKTINEIKEVLEKYPEYAFEYIRS